MSDNNNNNEQNGQESNNYVEPTSIPDSIIHNNQSEVNNVTNIPDTTNQSIDTKILEDLNSGLRRSSRVPKPRTDLTADLEDEYKKRSYKKRVKPKPKKKINAKDKKKKVTKPSKKLKKSIST